MKKDSKIGSKRGLGKLDPGVHGEETVPLDVKDQGIDVHLADGREVQQQPVDGYDDLAELGRVGGLAAAVAGQELVALQGPEHPVRVRRGQGHMAEGHILEKFH